MSTQQSAGQHLYQPNNPQPYSTPATKAAVDNQTSVNPKQPHNQQPLPNASQPTSKVPLVQGVPFHKAKIVAILSNVVLLVLSIITLATKFWLYWELAFSIINVILFSTSLFLIITNKTKMVPIIIALEIAFFLLTWIISLILGIILLRRYFFGFPLGWSIFTILIYALLFAPLYFYRKELLLARSHPNGGAVNREEMAHVTPLESVAVVDQRDRTGGAGGMNNGVNDGINNTAGPVGNSAGGIPVISNPNHATPISNNVPANNNMNNQNGLQGNLNNNFGQKNGNLVNQEDSIQPGNISNNNNYYTPPPTAYERPIISNM
ncbi:hypothetical protein HDU92_006393 [Lobulomyces angularis]|nr:hypothetical protein HDU92_006393 [Lobulomyces angularis]